jgi:hypothetical protein
MHNALQGYWKGVVVVEVEGEVVAVQSQHKANQVRDVVLLEEDVDADVDVDADAKVVDVDVGEKLLRLNQVMTRILRILTSG